MTDLDKKWARDLTDEQLISELYRIEVRLDKGFGEHGGSPGEWWYERCDELSFECKKRGIK